MKKIASILTIVIFVFTSCGSEKKKDNEKTHTHEDGTVHRNDAHEYKAMPEQESFEVEADSTQQHAVKKQHDHDYMHEHEGKHDHQH